jgi:acetoin utilization deacetylase AcuC-like enzyme
MQTGIVKDKRYTEHDMGPFHVESPRRIEAIYDMLEKEISFPYLEIKPRPAKEEEVEMVHNSAYVNLIKETSGQERVYLDPDTSTSARSYEVALLAAGGLALPWSGRPAIMLRQAGLWDFVSSTISPSLPNTWSKNTASSAF